MNAMRRRGWIVNICLAAAVTGAAVGLAVRIDSNQLTTGWRSLAPRLPDARAQGWTDVLSAVQERMLKPRDSFKDCGSGCPEMIVVPAGTFLMGSPAGEPGYRSFEQPLHQVVIARPFAVSKFELSFAEWDACAGHGGCDPQVRDSGFGRGRKPVINVTWDDAQGYVAWLSKMTGKPYRLLSEAEYEYAARSGTETAYPWGEAVGSNNANCNGCGSRWDDMQTAPVGSFPPNRFGLYDTVGNVYEWVDDCLHGNYDGAPTDGAPWIAGGACSGRMLRGGSWADDPIDLRSASRTWSPAIIRRNFIGFRVARSLDPR